MPVLADLGRLALRLQTLVAHEAVPHAMLNGTTTRSPTARLVDGRPDRLDDAHRFVAEDVARRHERGQHLVEVEVGTAQSGRRDLDDRVGRLLDRRVGDRLDPHVARPCHTTALMAAPLWRRRQSLMLTR